VIGIRGPDARRFLQGQLSNDMGLLGQREPPAPGGDGPRLLRAGLHSAQGRTLALLGLVALDQDTLLAVLPREIIDATLATLRRYVLRAKVSLADQSEAWRLYGLLPPVPTGGDGLSVLYEDTRRLLLLRANDTAPSGEPLAYERWHALDVAAGLPQVYAASAGQFVAQMLNLDCIGAISFTKGCYTGQEVIARAHYRGRVKRRMQRYLSSAPLQLSPGDSGQLSGGGNFTVVDSAQRADGRCEFLAITALAAAAPQASEGGPSDVVGDLAPAGGEPSRRVDAELLPLPYPLPE
jgi:folate-binding protein YgfZ